MAVNEVLNQLQGLIRGAAPQLIEISNQLGKAVVPFVPGERYIAKVQEQIANGRFLVQIRDQTLDLNLPRNTQAGQNLELRFVAATPRLTFVLVEAPARAPGQPAGPVNLSDGARYLNALLDRVQNLATQQALPGNKAQAQGALAQQIASPVLTGAPPAPALFAALLKDAVSKSGLFYESHQAQWAAGDKPLSEILREPQGRLSDSRAFNQAATPPGQQGVPAEAAKAGAAHLLALHASVADGKEPVHPLSAPLVQQQLEVLDTRQLIWQGQVWPGQELRWQIEERAAQEGDDEVEREWQTQLNLTLPNLGEVSARLSLAPQGGIRIALTATAPEIAQTLQAASAALNQSLASAGLQLIQLEVGSDG